MGVVLLGLCSCGGLVGLMGFAFNAGAEEARQRVIGPWLEAIREQDYERAAEMAGEGVTADDLMRALDRELGVPLVAYRPMVIPPVRVSVDAVSGRESYEIAYELTGARLQRTIRITAERPGGGGWIIGIPAWGLAPTAPSAGDDHGSEEPGTDEAAAGESAESSSDSSASGGGIVLPPAETQD